MLIRILRGKYPAGQTVWLVLMLLLPLPALLVHGLAIVQPEDSSVLYKGICRVLESFPLWGKMMVWYLFILFLLYQGSVLWTIMAPGRRARLVPMISGAMILFLLPQNNLFHPVLPALGFLLPGVISLMKASVSQRTRVYLFNAGLLISVASLLYYGFVLLLPFILIALLVLRLYDRTFFAVLLTGMGLPWLYIIVIQWIANISFDPGGYGVVGMYISNFLYMSTYLAAIMGTAEIMQVILLILLLIVVLPFSMKGIDQQIIATRQQYKVLYWLLLPSFLLLLVSGGMFFPALTLISVLMVPLMCDFLLQTKKPKAVNAALWIVLLSIAAFRIAGLQ
ncbi:MAG TPA: hypothetical protein P5228_02520 [Bacteroidales bacterium]|nr:hypothetical protein [Bacteroidales bacterium]HRZ48573.1 hypothetical protein [Bacteroidales bacterium]